MGHQRSLLAGMTDYTGVSLSDILADFENWLKLTSETVEKLQRYAGKIEKNKSLIENPREVLSFIYFFIDLFERYRNDLEKLLREMPDGIVDAHIETVKQLYESSKLEEDYTIRFKSDWICKSLLHEEMRPLLDDIYGDTRNLIVDYRDLSNVVKRLRALLRPQTESDEVLKDFQLKPNFFGIGVNLNRVFARFRKGKKNK